MAQLILDEKSKKLLEGLGGEGINVTPAKLAHMVAESGFNVTVHIGRMRGSVMLPPSAIGLDLGNMSKSQQDFYNDYVDVGTLNFIPKEQYEKKFQKIEGNIRYKCFKKCLIGTFMPAVRYRAFKEEFLEASVAYMAIRDSVVANWDYIIKEFSNGVCEMLKNADLTEEQRKAIHAQIMATVPAVNAYMKSFYMRLSITTFPMQSGADIFKADERISADVQTTWNENIVSTTCGSIEAQIRESFLKANTSLKYFLKRGDIPAKSKTALTQHGQELQAYNVFRNPEIKRLGDLLAVELVKTTTSEDAAEVIEDAILGIYAYAKDTKIALDMGKSQFSIEKLEKMFANRN